MNNFFQSKKEKKSETKKDQKTKRDSGEKSPSHSHSSLPVSPIMTKLVPATKSLSGIIIFQVESIYF